jgi:hypothetical protein
MVSLLELGLERKPRLTSLHSLFWLAGLIGVHILTRCLRPFCNRFTYHMKRIVLFFRLNLGYISGI